jgi:peptide/nickel transport system substrate-binding protein
LRVHTRETDAYVPRNLSNISIQARHAVAGRKSEDFNSGVAAVGTGPYRFMSWRPGEPVVLTRNDAYWGPRPDWAKVTLRPIPAAATREIALMTGEVDFIESVPPQDVGRTAEAPNLRVVHDLPLGVVFLQLDQFRDNSPSVFDNDGKPLERNPFKDKRARLALSKAINREVIVQRSLAGAGVPASQLLPDGKAGVSPRLKVEPFDPEGARALLVQAGYPDGFRITLLYQNDLYAGDAEGAQAIAQMLTRVGVKRLTRNVSRTSIRIISMA